MHKRNGRIKDIRHSNMLHKSDQDMVQLGIAVHHRFLSVCELYFKVKGIQLIPPVDLNADMLIWRTMMMRFNNGDDRNTEDEKWATRRVAQWTLDVNSKLRNQKPVLLEWGD